MPINWRSARVLTFDCYGTLVDWEQGLLATLRPLVRSSIGDAAILGAFASSEARIEAGPYTTYREVLARVGKELSGALGFGAAAPGRNFLADSLVRWPLFKDTRDSLAALRDRFEIGIISNIDDDLARSHFANVGLEVDWIVTAQSCESYKPSRRNFDEAARRHGLGGGWVHCAQSLYHDIAPCREMGIPCVWIDRRAGREGAGATPTAAATPDARYENLRQLILDTNK